MIAYLNGQFLDEEDAVLNVKDLSIQRGYGVFDFLCFREGKPLYLQDYMDRFYTSAQKMFMEVPLSIEETSSIIHQLIKQNHVDDGGIRLQLTGGVSADGYSIAKPGFFITQHHLPAISDEQFHRGSAVISYEYQRTLPEIKSTNYLMGVWLNNLLKRKNAQDVVYHRDCRVSEFPRANIFMVDGSEKIKTPAKNILRGITRKKVIALAQSRYEVVETDVAIDDLLNASEVFLTSSTRLVFPVTKINEATIGSGIAGPVTTTLYKLLLQDQENYLNR